MVKQQPNRSLLGALQTYGLLADLLLPGVTTITTRTRYLSMLCAATFTILWLQTMAMIPASRLSTAS